MLSVSPHRRQSGNREVSGVVQLLPRGSAAGSRWRGWGRVEGGGVGVPPLRDLTEDREAAAASARSSERLSGCGTNRFGVALRELDQ